MATYKDLLEAGRVNTIRPIRDDERKKLPAGWDTVDRYTPYDPESVAHRGDWGNADNAFMNDEDWQYTKGQQAEWFENDALRKQALAAGDTELVNYYAGLQKQNHENVEQRRYKYGYTGGIDGTGYDVVLADVTGLPQSGGDGYGGSGGGGASGYQSQYQSMIDSLLSGILNRGPFSYNKDTDELYRQYEESHTRGGNRAMQDTLAQMSARTGGLASSYAGSAAQQTFNDYMARLADKVPELYQMRYNQYLNELQQQRADLDMVMGVDNMYYGRHRDTVADQQWQQQFDYNAYRDMIGDSQWQQQFDYGAGRDTVADNQYTQALAQSQVDAILSAGGTPSQGLLEQAGYSGEYANALQNYYAQQAAAKVVKGSGDGYRSGDDTPAMSLTTAKQAAAKGVFSDDVLAVLRKNGYTDEILSAVYGYVPARQPIPGTVNDDFVKKPNDAEWDWSDLEDNVGPTIDGVSAEIYAERAGNYSDVAAACEEVMRASGKGAVLSMLEELKGQLNSADYQSLKKKYGGM